VTKSARTFLILLLIAANILNQADRQIIALLKPMMETDLGWTDALYGTLVGAFQLAAALAFPLAGWFVDRIEPKWANAAAVGTWSLAAAAHGVASSFAQFLTARISLGAAEALGTPITIKTIAVMFEDGASRSLYLGMMGGAGAIGAITVPFIVPNLAVAFGWRWTFVVAGAAGLAWAVAWLAAARSTSWRWHGTDQAEGSPVSWHLILKDWRVWSISVAKVLSDQAWWFLLFWTPDYLHRAFHLSVTQLSLPVACIFVMSSLGSLLGGVAPRTLARLGWTVAEVRRRVMLAAGLIIAPFPFVFYVHDLWQVTAWIGVVIAAHQVFSVNLFGVITDVMPANRVGRVTGVAAFWGNLGGMAIVQTTGWLLTAGLGYLPMLTFVGLAYLAAPIWLRLTLPKGQTPAAGFTAALA
jgi:MFS transporter, ACS family, hexuronate transporter